ncbi:hypothetical protein C8F04DRAFT_1387461 [Mycena alexandri]|uniref:F-box domain-containing protein n=1 Tax=Mycena alexandri TaxID=1745969 RepID=A0AAD6XJ35_9AGAR|nr:hypothetical protein C8F04DRAFT_1387461 [Mycena alexandri]
MSIKDLATRIEVLSAEIERQKKVLNQLERSKKAAQRQLNALRDPIARLPLEISSEIFLQCIPSYPHWQTPKPRVAPMLLLNVCNAWSNIALSNPALWVALAIDKPCDEFLQIWLQRARGYPLSVSLEGVGDLNKEVTILGKYSKQLKHLEICVKKLHLDPFISVGPFPSLETLEIGGEDELRDVSISQIIDLLALAPNLADFTLRNVFARLDYDNKETAILPNIRRLKFGSRTNAHELNTDDDLLQFVSLPGLTTLFFGIISPPDFSLFLERSSPPLETLGLGCHGFGFSELAPCLRLVPSLLHLELCTSRQKWLMDSPLALANSSELLPNLESLEMRYCRSSAPPAAAYEVLLRALTMRREHLRRFGLRGVGVVHPEQEICDALRRLAADGMEIYIGTDDCNFISS